MPRSPVPHEEQIENAQRARKLARLIDRVLLKRTRVNYQDESWLRKYEYLDESAEALKIALADTNVSNVTPARLEKIAELQLQLRSDYDAIKFRNKTFRDLQNSLSNLEFRLAAKESTILDVVSSFAGRLPSDASDTESLGARTAASTKSNTPSLLKLFYERKGDEGIFLERLQEQELFYREGLVERDLVADRGDPLPMTDEQFEHDCRVQYEDILSDLLAAQKDVVRLRDQCEAAGLETEVRRPPSDDLSFSNPPPVDDDPISPPLVPHEFLQTVDGQPLLDGARPSDRPGDNVIQGWLDNVSADPIEVSDTANIALEGTTAAYDDSVCHDHETAQLSPPEKISSLPVMADNSAWLEGVTASALALEMESVQPLAATHDGLAADEKFLAEIPAASWSSRQPLP
ncbi:hypothetical protein B0A55_12160 [Friedmanniomyces simplex]|uniref:Uncharacterized protein n=1 Tax=Friedmanniomyces simplex TaxID=329884 RepID=A0A4U0W2T8_9PEZI|nr:hypothetical protein B0A55_12160 [Friedmanniomyces simplex]